MTELDGYPNFEISETEQKDMERRVAAFIDANPGITDKHTEGPFKGFSEWEVRATYALLSEKGFKMMHRRNGQFWLMLDRPMTFVELNHFASTDFLTLNGEPGHLNFDPLPEGHFMRMTDDEFNAAFGKESR